MVAKTHGMFGTKIYGSWSSMVQRCTDENHPYYKNYGGKGITVCDKWLKFEGFYEDMKDTHKNGLMIDRIEGGRLKRRSSHRLVTDKEMKMGGMYDASS